MELRLTSSVVSPSAIARSIAMSSIISAKNLETSSQLSRINSTIAHFTHILAISTMTQIQYFHRYLLNEFQRESMRGKYTILDRHIQ